MLLPIWPCCSYSASSKAMSPWLHTLPQHRPAYNKTELKLNTRGQNMFMLLQQDIQAVSCQWEIAHTPPSLQTP